MIKDRYTDYATAAFKDYAACGMTAQEYADRLYSRNINSAAQRIGGDCPKNNVGAAIAAAEHERAAYEPYIADLIAVEKTLENLQQKNKQHIVDALRAVYMQQPHKPMSQREIGRRVVNFAVNYPADVRTVYKWLKAARRLFAFYRGLNAGDGENGR